MPFLILTFFALDSPASRFRMLVFDKDLMMRKIAGIFLKILFTS
jgi:hypothetical protein